MHPSRTPNRDLIPQELLPIPRRHQFPLLWIDLFVSMVLVAATSLRAAAEVLRLLGGRLPALGERAPCANSGRMWLLRIGLYELQRPKERADDWVWLVDHTIQWGARKCLFLVGVRWNQWQRDRRPLTHRDFQVLALEPVGKSSGEIVLGQFEPASTPRMAMTVTDDKG